MPHSHTETKPKKVGSEEGRHNRRIVMDVGKNQNNCMGSFAEPDKADGTVRVILTNQPELKFPRAILLML